MVPFRSVAGVPAVVDVAATGGAVVGPAMLLLDNSAFSPCMQSFTLSFFEHAYSRFIPSPVAQFSWNEEQFIA
jgi:hypothetical protein